MISDTARYHGCVFHYLISRASAPLKIAYLEHGSSDFYIINGVVPLHIKYSTSRKGPWAFSFKPQHHRYIDELHSSYGDCLVGFVCGYDGIAGLRHNELRSMLVEGSTNQAGLTIRRKTNEMYQIKSEYALLPGKVSMNSLAEKLRDRLNEIS